MGPLIPNDSNTSAVAVKTWRALPAGVWAMGFASLFMDISSELIHSLLPVFMVGVLGASVLTVGIVEGVAEATASVVKVFSGALSDYLGRRKSLMVLGYALAAFTKPVFALAGSVGWVFAARFVDRLGKGIRGAPRDALIAEISAPAMRGAAYGLRQSLDAAGALLGPALAIVLMLALANNVRAVMWIAIAPAFICLVLLTRYVREPERTCGGHAPKSPLTFRHARRLPRRYWMIVLLGAVFTLARFSEAFLVLRARDVGVAVGYVPVVMVVMNAFYSAGAYPAGAASDKIGHRTLLSIGLMLLIAADLVLAAAGSPLLALTGAGLWGLHMALTQGLLAKLVSQSSPVELLGTAFGIFNLVSGGALLLASVIAGALWTAIGPAATFLAGAAFTTVAGAGLMAGLRLRRPLS
jgi:MFS family permease